MAITKIYKGNIVRDDIVKIYKGNELIYEKGETPSEYSVTITASGGWANASEGGVKIYDGQDNTGTLLLNQTPANMSAFPMTLQVSSGYCAVYFVGPGLMGIGSSSSQDFNIIFENQLIIGPINKNGSVDLTVYDFDD